MSKARLQQAFESMMQRAPSALFRKARALYLQKYPLDGRDCTSPLRLFVKQETIDEQIVTGSNPGERLAVVTIKPVQLALVHWQQPRAASDSDIGAYFQEQWGMETPTLEPQDDPWFRDGGHQSLLRAPEELIWLRRSPMPETD